MDEVVAYIGLGGNVGERPRTLLEALRRLDDVPGVRVRQVSSFIESEPVGGPPGQPRFLNAAAELRTSLPAEDLLRVLHEIEASLGRDRSVEVPSGPRTCDLDLLIVGSTVVESPGMTLPHPHMHERLFVLRPLAQIAPELVHPVLRKTIAELLSEAEAMP
jgi:2-amino-4-hydroxy-6-hydroxymethyldihydropteridine diphosphokinase